MIASQPTTTCTTPSIPITEGKSSSTSEQLRVRAVEFSNVLEYIPRLCRPFHQKHQVAPRDGSPRIRPRQTQTQMQAQMQVHRSGELLLFPKISGSLTFPHLLAWSLEHKVSKSCLHSIQPLPVASLMKMSRCSSCDWVMPRTSHKGVPQLPPLMLSSTNNVTNSIKLKNIPPGPLKPTGHKMFRWKKDFPGVIRPRSFEQKTSYKYRLIHNNDHVFEIARYDVYGDPKDENTPVHTS